MERRIVIDGSEWIARVAGSGAAGPRSLKRAPVAAIRFEHANGSGDAIFEAMAACGDLDALFEDELRTLFARARQLPRHRIELQCPALQTPDAAEPEV